MNRSRTRELDGQGDTELDIVVARRRGTPCHFLLLAGAATAAFALATSGQIGAAPDEAPVECFAEIIDPDSRAYVQAAIIEIPGAVFLPDGPGCPPGNAPLTSPAPPRPTALERPA